MVLVDKSILKLMKDGKMSISPFEKDAVTSNGYDLLLEDFEIAPGEFKIVVSKEKIKMPRDIVAFPFLRTTYAFKGMILSPGIVDAGFEGRLKFALYNSSKKIIRTEKRDILKRIVTLVFFNSFDKANLSFGQRKGEKNNFQ